MVIHQIGLGRRRRSVRASATNFSKPEERVKFRVVGLNLPSFSSIVKVTGHHDIDTLDTGCTRIEGSLPSEREGVASDGIDADDSKTNGWLRTLTSFESGLGGKGDCAVTVTSYLVDAIRGIGEVVGEESFSSVVVIVCQEKSEAVDQIIGSIIGQAEGAWDSSVVFVSDKPVATTYERTYTV